MKKPTLHKGPASNYAAPNEIIREFSLGETGGLLSLRALADGSLVIELYRTSGDITVHTDGNCRRGEGAGS